MVQNVTFTLEVAFLVFLVFLAFVLRRNRNVHGALLMSTALMFLVIALFFSFISYAPGYRVEGPETFDRFAKSGQMAALIGAVIGLLFFLKHFRSEWLTRLVGSIGELSAFGLGLLLFAGAPWMTRRDIPRAVAAHSPDSS